MIALAIGCYQLSLPHVLAGTLGYNEGYDDGIYMGLAIRFVHGVLPYRDFVIVEPPGIAYLLAPIALIGSATTAHAALMLGRILTVLVTAANPVIAGLLVRRAGRLAVAFSSFALALWPMTVAADRSIELEPYLVFFSLLGSLVLLGRGDEPSKRRLLAGGILLGFACVTKAWGVLPAAAVLLVFLPRWRRGYHYLVAGVALGIVVPSLPFLIASPGAFWHQVVADQLGRNYLGLSTPLVQRLLLITGLPGLPSSGTPAILSLGGTSPAASAAIEATAVIAFLLVAVAVVVLFGFGWRRRKPLEWMTLALATITFVGMFDSAVFFDHYAYFPAAMLAPLLGVLVAGVRREVRARATAPLSDLATRPAAKSRMSSVTVVSVAVGVAATIFLISQNTAYAADYLSEASDPSALAEYVPPGACVLSDFPSDLIVADRFTPSSNGCPSVVDPLGMYIAEDNGLSPHPNPPYPLPFSYQWFADLQKAQYVELRIPFSDLIPWRSFMITWFNQNYSLVAHLHFQYSRTFFDPDRDIYIYEHTG